MLRKDWNLVVDYLNREFEPFLTVLGEANLPRAEDLRMWLQWLMRWEETPSEECIQNNRLAACMAIDLKSGNLLTEDLFHKILNRQKGEGYYITATNKLQPHRQFHNAANYHIENEDLAIDTIKLINEFYKTRFSTETHPANGYYRCVALPDFHKYMVMKGANNYDRNVQLSWYKERFNWDRTKSKCDIPFPEIATTDKVFMQGQKPIAWIFPKEDLKEATPENLATDLANQLTIAVFVDEQKLDWDVLVLMEYPLSGHAYQPTSIHANWLCGGFASYKKNDRPLGRTIGDMPEAIHTTFPVVADGSDMGPFKATLYGRVNGPIHLDFKSILDKTIDRYMELT